MVKSDVRTNKTLLLNEYAYEKSRRTFFGGRDNDNWVWHVFDASNGETYDLRDVSCPLKTVQYVFDDENVSGKSFDSIIFINNPIWRLLKD